MKAAWTRLARRIDAMSLRERALMAVSLAAALAAVADALVLSPQFTTQRAIVEQRRAQVDELAALRQRLSEPAAEGSLAGLQSTLAERRAALAAVDARIATRLGPDVSAPLPALLQRVLRRHERITLLSLDTPRPDPAEALKRRQVRLQLAGAYADLTAFVAETERALPALGWTEVAVEGGHGLPVLSARVWLPGDGT